MNGPAPDSIHPMAGFPQVCFIRNTVNNPNIVIGEYTYYDDPDDSENFERNVLYHTRVGNDVWIGYGATIMPGVSIGDGAIVASMSVVVSDVPAYTLVGGNPARPIRRRFPDDVISSLLDLKWWDWPVERITRNLEFIMGGDVEVLKTAAP